jgi:hypothetical protein
MADKARNTTTVAAGLVALLAGAWTAAAGEDPSTVMLHIDDHAQVSRAVQTSFEAEVSRIYAAAGVRTISVNGTADLHAFRDGLTHLTVVIVGARGIQNSDAFFPPTVAGAAARGLGRAYVHYERVVAAANRHARDVGGVLGMVIAHEVGHLLLPDNGHSAHGIMRSDMELTSKLPQEFTMSESAMLRGNLRRSWARPERP